jgi:hypothetical protein
MNEDNTEFTLLKDQDWGAVNGELCRVIDFVPLGSIKNGKKVQSPYVAMPYASITIECHKLPRKAKGFITHRLDFMHLWEAFRERGVKRDEEVLIVWSSKYRNFIFRLFSRMLPKLHVMICPKGSYEKILDSRWWTNLTLEKAKTTEVIPIVEWSRPVEGESVKKMLSE